MSDGLGNSIGQCIFSNASGPESMCDFAVFEVDGHIVYNCIRSLVDEKNKERKASLCKFDLSSLSGKYVHKKGASTEWTKGIIACAELHDRFSCGRTDSKELMVFEGLNKTQFADRGDSGSLVIAHDLRNNRNNLLVLGMVSGGELELREDNSSANTQNLTSYSLGFSLNHAIDLFQKKFSNIDLHFDNDIKSSSSESDSE
ncbi:hypothetical protein FSP39_018763 [Pinctada imbricata]|uniref:Uncharacterized protein n=1 Tax=Pinctada imbricata TaxID=66713 RepID=A0AA89BML9_PINIB|nr:hypothetical protein FSP39_018763 [Pinctada imbricata]